jgi:hypothetical protein
LSHLQQSQVLRSVSRRNIQCNRLYVSLLVSLRSMMPLTYQLCHWCSTSTLVQLQFAFSMQHAHVNTPLLTCMQSHSYILLLFLQLSN